MTRSGCRCARQAQGGLPCTESPAGVAQSAEQPSCKRQVSGSNPLTGSQVKPCSPSACSGEIGVSAAKSRDRCQRSQERSQCAAGTSTSHSKITLQRRSIAARSISGSTRVCRSSSLTRSGCGPGSSSLSAQPGNSRSRVLVTGSAPTAIRLSATVATIFAVSSGPASATVPEVSIEMLVTGASAAS